MTDRPDSSSRERSDEADTKWSRWTHPAESGLDESGVTESGPEKETGASDPPGRAAWKAPPAERAPTLRERIRRRYGLSDRQWYVIETMLLFAPYPVFVLVYFTVPVDETYFIVGTLLYSLLAMYIGFLS